MNVGATSGALLLAGAVICVWQATSHLRHWRRGRPVAAAPGLLAGLRDVARRYLRDVHAVVAREPRAARMHKSLAGGVLLALLAFVLTLTLPATPWSVPPVAAAVVAAMPGLWLEHRRRAERAPGRSGGRYDALPALFALLLCGVSLLTLARGTSAGWLGWPGAAAAGWAILRLSVMTGRGPMRHAFAGLAHLAAHPRPDRFGGRSVGLTAPDLRHEPLGVAAPTEFTRAQLVGFDACVQCGRCETACPAFAAGLPLNPKKLINDLAAANRGPSDYEGAPHPGLPRDLPEAGPILIGSDGGAALMPDTIWSCTTCRACVEACPMMIEHVDALIDLRRGEVMRRGAIAPNAQTMLESLRETDTQSGQALARRFDWATDLGLPRIAEGHPRELLLWVGESAFDRRAQRSLRALARLLRLAGVDVAILGEEERDCGDQARRLGDEATFQTLARANIATLSRYAFGAIVTADPHVMNALRNDYPALGGVFPVRHHTDVLAELVARGRLTPRPGAGAITYHDPCYLGRYNGEFEAPRRLIAALGLDLVEMERSGPRSHCCGGGGGAPLTDVPGDRRIPDMRMDQVRATGAARVAVACPGCAAMLEGVPDGGAEVRDIAELVLDRVELD